MLGHELKAPLNAIGGYLDLIRQHSLGEKIAAYDAIVVRSTARINGMYKLIHDLLDLTQIESGRKNRRLSEVDVCETAKKAIEAVRAEAEARNIAVHLHADAHVVMTADAGEIEIILNNLTSNAVKYNRDGGSVDVAVSSLGSRVTLTVTDTGIGMTPEDAAQIFDEFVRIKNEKTLNIEGTGLGLSIVKKLANLYHGDAVVESQPDVGSTFTVTLETEVAG
jgi:signal transduction histidine kinase